MSNIFRKLLISAASIAALIILFILPAGAATVTHDFSGRIDGHTGASPIDQHVWYDQHGTKHYVTSGDWLDNAYGNYWYYPITMISQDSVVYGPTYQFFATGIACYKTPPSVSSIGWDQNKWYNTDINGSYNIQCGNDYKSYFATHRNWNDYIPAGMAVYIDLNKTASYDLAANGRQPNFYLDGTLCLGTSLKTWAGTSYKGVFTPKVGDWSVANMNYGSNAAITPNTPIQGVNTVDVLIGDIWGNIAYKEFAFRYDTVAPSASFTPGSAGWDNSTSVVINPSDGTSGVKSYIYRISANNGSTWGGWSSTVTGDTNTTVTLTTQGTDRIQVQVTDNAGNVGTVTSGQYLIDTTVPSTTFSPNSCTWRNSPIGVTLQPTDTGGSGVSSYIYRISTDNGSTWGGWSSRVSGGGSTAVTLSTQGTNLIQTQVIDNAGNVGTVTSGQYLIDTTAPTATFSPDSCTWRGTPINITLQPADTGGSGVKSYIYRISADDGGTWGNWSSAITGAAATTVTLSGQGTNRIQVQVTDNAGNVGTVTSGQYQLGVTMNISLQTPNADYLTDTDVITSANVKALNDSGVTPDLNATVVLTVKKSDGSVYTTQSKAMVCPGNKTNLIWFRWHTPAAAGTLSITAKIDCAAATADSVLADTMNWNVKVPTENTPPATSFTDTEPSWFSVQTPATSGLPSSLSWNDYIYQGGAFVQRSYTAALSASLSTTPSKTASGSVRIVTATNTGGVWQMKAGYPINEQATSGVAITSATGSAVDSQSATAAQLAEGRYPEFNYWYGGYFRLLDSLGSGSFQLRPNPYSQYSDRVHYTPVWFPDGPYTTLVTVSQAWTPAGAMGIDATDTLQISGALPQDWYVRILQ